MAMFSENSSVSSMRVMSFLSLLFGAAIAIFGLHADKSPDAIAVLCGVFVGSAFAGKAVSKFAEVKTESEK